MKKVISVLLSLSFCMSIIPKGLVEAKETESIELKNTIEYKTINGLGAIPEEIAEIAETGNVVTRGVFAAIIHSIVERNIENPDEVSTEWEESFWGEDFLFDVKEPPKIEKGHYSDIDSSYIYFEEINFVTNCNLMHGVGDNQFAPNSELKYNEVTKVLVTMLGYTNSAEMQGGFPNGYIAQAGMLGIDNPSSNDVVTYYDLVRILYDALDANIMEFSITDGNAVYTESEATFLSKWFGASYRIGVLTDNGITSISSMNATSRNQIVIGDYKYNNKCKEDISEYLGYNVKVYYSIEDETEGDALFVEPMKNNEATGFEINDYFGYDGGIIEYYENNKLKKIRLSDAVFVIYNGKCLEKWNADIFEFTNGNVRIIQNGEWYDVIIVEDYETWIVSDVDLKNNKIYNKLQDNDNSNDDIMLDYTDSKEDELLFVVGDDGEKLDVSTVVPGMIIDIIINDNYIKMVLSNNTIKDFAVKSCGTDDEGRRTISNGDKIYVISPDYYEKKDNVEFENGQVYTLYLNSQGYVIWQEKKQSSGYIVGYLVKVIDDYENEQVIVKVYNEQGTMISASCDVRITYRTDSSTKYKLEYETLKLRLKEHEGKLIRYKLNEDGKLTYIEIVAEQPQNGEYLQELYNSGETKLQYKNIGSWSHFGGELIIDNNTKIFRVPLGEEFKGDERYYSIVKRETVYKFDGTYTVVGYGLQEGVRYADYIIIKKNDGEKSIDATSHSYFFVDRIYKGLDTEDEVCTVVEGWKCGYGVSLKKTTLYAKDEGNGPVVEKMRDVLKTEQVYNIKKGDVLRCTYSGPDDEYIENAELLFRLNEKNPAWPDGKNGFLAGTVGYYDGSLYSNPYAINSSHTPVAAESLVNGNYRVFYGFVQSVDKGTITATTKDLTQGAFETDNSKYAVNYLILAQTVLTLTIDGDKYDVKAGTINDIKEAKNYGDNGSRIIYVTQYGVPYTTIIINEL